MLTELLLKREHLTEYDLPDDHYYCRMVINFHAVVKHQGVEPARLEAESERQAHEFERFMRSFQLPPFESLEFGRVNTVRVGHYVILEVMDRELNTRFTWKGVQLEVGVEERETRNGEPLKLVDSEEEQAERTMQSG